MMSIKNARFYRKEDVAKGDWVTPEKYIKNGVINGIPVNGVCEVWGIVVDITSDFHCLVMCKEVRNNGITIEISDENQYMTSINFWRGKKRKEAQINFEAIYDREPELDELLKLEAEFSLI